MTNVLVTGGAGYIGSNMVHFLMKMQNITVVILDNLSTGFKDSLHPKVKFYEGDIQDNALVKSIIKEHNIDSVIHFAASIRADESVIDPYKYYHNNTCNTLEFLKSCAEMKNNIKHFIFSSTAAVYGNSRPNFAIDELVPCSPISPYGFSKFMSEQILKDFSSVYGFKYSILRYFNVAGADLEEKLGQRSKDSKNLIRISSDAALNKRPRMIINGNDYPTKDGTCIRDFIHVKDLVTAHWCALNYLKNGGQDEVFNLGYGQETTVKEVVSCMKKISGNDFKVEYGPRRDGDIYYSLANCDKAKKVLNWIPQFNTLEEICKSSFEWEKLNG